MTNLAGKVLSDWMRRAVYSIVLVPLIMSSWFVSISSAESPVNQARLGVATNRNPLNYPHYTELQMGWYQNWGARPWNSQVISGTQFVPTVAAFGDLWGDETESKLRGYVATVPGAYPPGTVWLVGNELTMDKFSTANGQPIEGGPRVITAEEYAQKFKKYYDMIKRIDPSYRIGVGHTYLSWESSDFLQRTRQAYQNLYGAKMPIEVYTLHTYWPSWNPGDNLINIHRQVIDMREQMLSYGDRDKPLYITEMGSLSESATNPGSATINAYMNAAFDYANTWISDTLGCPGDGYRMVQRWAWFALTSWDPSSDTRWQGTDLINISSGELTPMGVNYASYPKSAPALPSAFWGSVSNQGQNVAEGTVVSAWIGDVRVSESFTSIYSNTSVYSLDVPADDPDTSAKEGGVNGDAVRFKIGSSWAAQSGTWQGGTVVNLNLSLAAAGGLYFAPSSNWVANFGTSAGGWTNYDMYPRAVADVNGDGKADVVGFGGKGVYVALSTGSGFETPTLWMTAFGSSSTAGGWTSQNITPRMMADVDGDGKADIVAFGRNGVLVSRSTGAGFTAAQLWIANFGVSTGGWTSFDKYPRAVADVTGDGKADIVGFGNKGAYVALSSGSAFQAPTLWIEAFGYASSAGSWTSYNLYPRAAADVSGDDRADVVGFYSNGVRVSLAMGE
jgi:hypothetical protein